MGIAEDIKNLGEDIVTSYDMRVKAIGVLVKDTHNMLKGFQTEHKEMSDKLKADLAKGEEDRLKNFKAMMAEIQKFVSDIAEEVSAMIKRFQEEHKAMANEQRKNLEKGEGDRLKAFNSMIAKIQEGIKEIETYVKNKLKEFSDAHADMSEELKKALAKYVDDMVKATKKLMGDIQKRQEERNAEVADLLEAFKTEREEMAANWQALTATMAKKRGIMPKVEAEVKVRPVKEAIEELKPVEEVEEEVTPEMKLEKKVLKFIEKHPKGVKVGDMEETLGVARTRLGVIAKKLLDEGKVRKEENMYFPL
jgi:gas vesicle protein